MIQKIVYSLVFFIGISIAAHSQLRIFYDGLEPSEEYFDIADYKLEYNQKIKEKLFDGLADHYKVRMLVRPSFDAEYIFQIDEIIKDYQLEKYDVRFHKSDSSIWYAKDYTKIKVKKYEASISEEDLQLLTDAFAVIVDKTRYEKSNMDIYDGTNYLLSIHDFDGWRSGNVKKPNEEIKSLIGVVENLIVQTQSKRAIKITKKDKEILTYIVEKAKQNPTSSDYELMSRIVKVIEENGAVYCSKLKEDNIEYVENTLENIQSIGTKDLAYHNFNRKEFKEYIEYILDEFVSFNTFSGDYESINLPSDYEFEKQENIENNIFKLILKEFD